MRNLFEWIYYLRELLLLLLAVLISVTLLLTNESRQAVFLQSTYAGIIAALPRPNLGISDMISYREENGILRERLIQYGLLNAELAQTARENAQLRQMLAFARQSPHRLQAAEVISRGAASLLSTVTISAGSNQGVRINDPILSLDGVLGKVLSVAANAAVIHLVTDRNFRVSVKLGDTAVRGILRPTRDGRGLVDGVPPNSRIAVGDQVLTSGFSDIFPRNLPVAVVESVTDLPGENFSRITVRLNTQPSATEHVFVLMEGYAGS